jgi:hypothetical protein
LLICGGDTYLMSYEFPVQRSEGITLLNSRPIERD